MLYRMRRDDNDYKVARFAGADMILKLVGFLCLVQPAVALRQRDSYVGEFSQAIYPGNREQHGLTTTIETDFDAAIARSTRSFDDFLQID